MKQSEFLQSVLTEALRFGWTLDAVDDGGGPVGVVTVDQAMEAAKAVDTCYIFLNWWDEAASKMHAGWFFIVWQGPDETHEDGAEVVSDYTVILNDIMETCYKAA